MRSAIEVVLTKYKYLGLSAKDLNLGGHWEDLLARSLRDIAYEAKPKFIPLFVANLMWRIGWRKPIKQWFGGSALTGVRVANNQLIYTRDQYIENDFIANTMRLLIQSCFLSCSTCGYPMDSDDYGIERDCVSCRS